MTEEEARRDRRSRVPHALQELRVEGGDETPVADAEHLGEASDAARHRPELHTVSGLDLDDVSEPPAVPVKDRLEARDAVVAELRRYGQPLDLAPREAAHRDALSTEDDFVVVEEHGLAVARLADVELDGVHAEALGEIEALDRVLAGAPGGAAVADDPGPVGLLPLAHGGRIIAEPGPRRPPRGSDPGPPPGPARPSPGVR